MNLIGDEETTASCSEGGGATSEDPEDDIDLQELECIDETESDQEANRPYNDHIVGFTRK